MGYLASLRFGTEHAKPRNAVKKCANFLCQSCREESPSHNSGTSPWHYKYSANFIIMRKYLDPRSRGVVIEATEEAAVLFTKYISY